MMGMAVVVTCPVDHGAPVELDPVVIGRPVAKMYTAAVMRCPSCGRQWSIEVSLRAAPTPVADRQRACRGRRDLVLS